MNFKKMQGFLIMTLVVIAVAGCIIFYIRSDSGDVTVIQAGESDKGNVEVTDENVVSASKDKTQGELETKTVFIHVAGQVKNPGVYELQFGARVIDAVNMAGGPLDEADLDSLNLAKKLNDEEKVYVPKKGESMPVSNNPATATANFSTSSAPANLHKININTAGLEELKSLPGIGDVLAERIIEYRNANGPFKKIEDIMNVEKIGPKTFENIKDKITI